MDWFKLLIFLVLCHEINGDRSPNGDPRCEKGKFLYRRFLKMGQLEGIINGFIDVFDNFYCNHGEVISNTNIYICWKTTTKIENDVTIGEHLMTFCTEDVLFNDPILPSDFDFLSFGEKTALWRDRYYSFGRAESRLRSLALLVALLIYSIYQQIIAPLFNR